MEDLLTYDLFNLAAFDSQSLKLNVDTEEEREELLLEHTTQMTQCIVKKIFQCTIEPSDVGPVAVLPAEKSRLPRAKRIPEPKPETKWERFAKEKGIKKKKRERMVFDEQVDEYKPRFGYKRANGGIEDIPIVEVKQGRDPFEDPWAAEKVQKKQRVAKNLLNQEQNAIRASGGRGGRKKAGGGAGPKEYDPVVVPGIPLDMMSSSSSIASSGRDPKKGGKRGRSGLHAALQLVQHSTASMGRFDEMRPDEPMRKMRGKKQSFRDNFAPAAADKESMKAQLRVVADKVDKKRKGVTNSLSAYEGIIPDAPSDSFRKKKGKGKASSVASSSSRSVKSTTQQRGGGDKKRKR